MKIRLSRRQATAYGERGGCDMATYTTVCKVVVTAVLVVWWLFGPMVGFCPVGKTDGHTIGMIWGHLLWPLSHANVWHLAGNLWVLWWLKGRLCLREAFVMAVVCSFLPELPGVWEIIRPEADASGTVATCGFSGVLCAMIGVKWGRWIRSRGTASAYREFAKRVLPFVAVGFFIPHVNWSIHLYCLLAGVVYGMVAVTRQHTGHG